MTQLKYNRNLLSLLIERNPLTTEFNIVMNFKTYSDEEVKKLADQAIQAINEDGTELNDEVRELIYEQTRVSLLHDLGDAKSKIAELLDDIGIRVTNDMPGDDRMILAGPCSAWKNLLENDVMLETLSEGIALSYNGMLPQPEEPKPS